MKTTISKAQLDAIQAAMDGNGRVEFDELARIFGAVRKPPEPSEDERYAAYLQAVGEGDHSVTTVSADEYERLRAQALASEQAEAERLWPDFCRATGYPEAA